MLATKDTQYEVNKNAILLVFSQKNFNSWAMCLCKKIEFGNDLYLGKSLIR